MPHDLRDVGSPVLLPPLVPSASSVVDFLGRYHTLTGLAFAQLLGWLGLSSRKFARWKDRYGRANEPNPMIPRDHRGGGGE